MSQDDMTPKPTGGAPADAAAPRQIAAFLAHHAPFGDLDHAKRDWVAESVSERLVRAGETVLREGDAPGTALFVVRHGAVEAQYGERSVDVWTSGEVFGVTTLVTGDAPEYTARAREDTLLYVVPGEVALDILSRPAGLAFIAHSVRDFLSHYEHTANCVPVTRSAAVAALVQGTPHICTPETTIREATRLMSEDASGAVLVRTPDGLGIVTNTDLRDRVVLAGTPPEAPVVTIMTFPARTVRADALAADAAVEMIDAGVKHLVVVDARGEAVGIVSADSFLTLDALSPLALRRAFAGAHDAAELARVATRLPDAFLGLVDSRLEAPAISRILTAQHDAIVMRLLELAFAELGAPPVGYAWLAFGSAARGELTLGSDQDNALAYEGEDDPAVESYFARLATVVTAGLADCGFAADSSGVTAANEMWRLPLPAWTRLFEECLRVPGHSHLMGASIAFDFRRVAGELEIVPPLVEVMRTAPEHPGFLAGLATTITTISSPLGFLRRLAGPVDVKRSGLLPVQNLARYHAVKNRLTMSATLDRIAALEGLGDPSTDSLRSLRAAYSAIADLRLQHHAELLRAGRPTDNVIDTAELPRLTHATLQEALRVVDDAQKTVPPPLHGWG